MEGISVEFNGEVYIRSPKSRYYFKHTTRNAERKNAKQLHRAVWEFYNGPIPKGFHVHHIDGNVDNNDISNLECLPAKEHLSRHARENEQNPVYVEKQMISIKKAGEKSKEWHSSPEGREWHRQHANVSVGKVRQNPVSKVCEYCGTAFKGLPWSKFCCTKCQVKARWQRQKLAKSQSFVSPFGG